MGCMTRIGCLSSGSASVGPRSLSSLSLSAQSVNGENGKWLRVRATQLFWLSLCLLQAALGPHAPAPAALGGETNSSRGGSPSALMGSCLPRLGP